MPATQIPLRRLQKTVEKPKRATIGSAGFDLCAPYPFVLKSGSRETIMLGLQTPSGILGENCCLFICGRSSLAKKPGIIVGGGLCDSDYQGEIGVVLINTGPEDVTFETKDRIAQVVPLQLFDAQFVLTKKTKSNDRENVEKNGTKPGTTGISVFGNV